MHKPFTLQPLMNLAQHQTESATRELGQLNQREHAAQDKLEMLQQYRNDYQTRLQASIQNGMEPLQLRNFQQFINKLDDAIAQQKKAVLQSHLSVERGRTEFDSTQRKLKSYSTLHDRYLEEQKHLDSKAEQHLLDEHTGRFAAYRMQQADEKNHH
ncbi:MAG: flagellar protein FliJ [Pseudomonadota bacterium]|jgi:flagellar FliJ protein